MALGAAGLSARRTRWPSTSTPRTLQHVAELGRVDHVDLQEQHVGARRDRVHAALLALLGGVLGGVAGLAAVGDDVERPSWARESVMNRRAPSSNSIRSARSSVVRVTREISETTMMPAMNSAEMAMPSGFSMMFSTRAYSRTSGEHGEADGGRPLPAADRGDGHGDGAGDHHRQDAGGVRAGLGVDVGVERDGDDDADRGVDEHHRAHGAAPLRRHAVARAGSAARC